MGIRLIPPERFAEVQRALHGDRKPDEPQSANLLNAAHLSDPELLDFRGHVYRVPPVSGLDGIRLAGLVEDYQKAAERGADAFRRAHLGIVDFLWRLASPRGLGGVLWRLLLPNPFRQATHKEVGHLLHFFGQSLMTSSVRYRFHPEASNRLPTGSN